MDYESMTTRQLQELCRSRGVPTSRAKADMVARLTADDSLPDVSLTEGEFVLSASAVRAVGAQADHHGLGDTPNSEQLVAPGTFQMTFPATDGGPDDEEHLANRQATLQAAREAGFETRGDAHRTGTVGGQHVYVVGVRQVT